MHKYRYIYEHIHGRAVDSGGIAPLGCMSLFSGAFEDSSHTLTLAPEPDKNSSASRASDEISFLSFRPNASKDPSYASIHVHHLYHIYYIYICMYIMDIYNIFIYI